MAAQPPFAYQDSMPFAREPLKSIYVCQRLLTTLLLVPIWATKYAVLPRRRRPRQSWSLKQIIIVNFMRRVYKVTELAGVTWSTRDPTKPCDNRTLKETTFEWIEPLPQDLRSGIVVDEQVPFRPVGAFVWPKNSPPDSNGYKDFDPDIEAHAGESDDVPLIGIFLHGGGYCHMSAHEDAGPSRVPRRLSKDKAFTKIYSVEYRLLQYAPFPAAVQDVAAVYAHIVRQHQRQPQDTKSPKPSSTSTKFNGDDVSTTTTDFLTANFKPEALRQKRQKDEVKARVAEAVRNTRCKIVLMGDSSGGNLVLATARWIRDEGVLPPPHGLLLLSPSCDTSHVFPDTPSSYMPRPHGSTDYLVDTPEPRALLQRTFLGHNPLETVHSPYVSPASRRVLCAFYGAPFAESVEGFTIARLDPAAREALRTMASEPGTPFAPDTGAGAGMGAGPTSLAHPVLASPRGLSLFSEFPRTCVVLGDAERLEREVVKLVGAMERDGVAVRTVWVVDGVHDVLTMGWWDERVRAKVWRDVEDWVAEVRRDA